MKHCASLCLAMALASCAAPERVERPVAESTVVAVVPPVRAPVAAPKIASAYENEINLVETLLTKSSAAKRVTESDDATAIAQLEKAKQLLQQAKQSDGQPGRALLSQAKRAMFSALRAGSGPVRDDADYLSLTKTTRVMLDAYGRILKEKSLEDVGNVEVEVVAQLELSESHAEKGDVKLAEQTAEAAFRRVREAIVGLRGGDTLVRRLRFETSADEYRYEVDRNRTHEMLVKLLVEKRPLAAAESEKVRQLMDAAGQSRRQAEARAREEDYPSAIKALEESTDKIIRAIRTAGIYIPG